MEGELRVVRVPGRDQAERGVEFHDIGVPCPAVEWPRHIEGHEVSLCRRVNRERVARQVARGAIRSCLTRTVVSFEAALGSIGREDDHLGVGHGSTPAPARVRTSGQSNIESHEFGVGVIVDLHRSVVGERRGARRVNRSQGVHQQSGSQGGDSSESTFVASLRLNHLSYL